jgi:hypothetical protein
MIAILPASLAIVRVPSLHFVLTRHDLEKGCMTAHKHNPMHRTLANIATPAALREIQVTYIFLQIVRLLEAIRRYRINRRNAALQRDPGQTKAKLDQLQDRIYRVAKVPPLPPNEYRFIAAALSAELFENHFEKARTAQAVLARAGQQGLRLAIEDVFFVFDAVEEMDPGFKYTSSVGRIAYSYCNFVLMKCEETGVKLTKEERRLIETHFLYFPST